MLDVALVAVGAAVPVPVLPAAWILCCLWIIWIILFLHSSRTRAFSSFFVCPIFWSLKNSQEYQTSLQCSVSLRIHMDILFSSTRYGNEFLPTPSITPQSISFFNDAWCEWKLLCNNNEIMVSYWYCIVVPWLGGIDQRHQRRSLLLQA